MMSVLAVAAGGALGSAARFALGNVSRAWWGASFPWGTLIANVLGSFLLGFLAKLGLESRAMSPALRLALTTGFCGGFTTYSTFNLETLGLFDGGEPGKAALYMALTLGLSIAAGLLGFVAARLLV